ncbi:MAG: ATP-binding protein [Candidatus Limnocylindrales bacterium]
MNGLSLRSRLFFALATVALLPVLVFGAIAVWRSSTAQSQQEQTAALNLARLAAADQSRLQLPNAPGAARLAALTGASVTVFGIDGSAHAQAGPGAIDTLPAAPGSSGPAGESAASGGFAVSTGGVVTAVVPLVGASGQPIGYLALTQPAGGTPDVGVVLAAALAMTVIWAVFLSFALAHGLIHPMRELTATLDRLQAGDLSARIVAPADDELGRLAESHNRLAAALAARNESLHQVLEALASLSPREGVGPLVAAAEQSATTAFGFRSVEILLAEGEHRAAEGEHRAGDAGRGGAPSATSDAAGPGGAGGVSATPRTEERIPGEAWTVVAPLRLGDDQVGWLRAVVPPMRDWGPADADLLALFGSQLAAAVRNAELYAEVSSLSELKSEFLRGVSHNLQTPLTSIRAFAERLAARDHDPALRIIVEQTDRLTRLVAQLLTVSRLEAGILHPREEVVALAPMVHRAWESLGHDEVPFSLHDESAGWLALADRDWVDQVIWALLDNAVKHGGGAPVEVAIRVDREGPEASVPASAAPASQTVPSTGGDRLVVTVRDHGPGIPEAVRQRMFDRFSTGAASGGTGLGLNVARGLLETMGGAIRVEHPGEGAAFVFTLPAEPAGEG